MRSHWVVLLAAALLIACHDSTGPNAPIRGDYDLVSVGGHALPALVQEFGGASTYVTVLRVSLVDGGAGLQWRAVERDSVVMGNGSRFIATSEPVGAASSVGAAVTLTQFFGTSEGRVHESTLTLPRSGGEMVFERVAQ